jgi:hypothetical protein
METAEREQLHYLKVTFSGEDEEEGENHQCLLIYSVS